MKKILISATAVAMFFAAGCSDEELVQDQQNETQEVSLEVNMGVNSRTGMTEDGCVWKVGDAIYAFSENKSVWGVLKIEDTNDIADNGKTATFRGTKNGTADLKHVIYPAKNSDKDVRPDEFSINVEHVEGNEGLKAPMIAEIGANTTFGYVGGLVKFQITGLGNKEVVFNAKVNGVDVTGGLYRWENGGLKYYPYQGMTTVHNIPEDGVFYLPVAVTTKAEGGVDAPEAVITAYAQNNPNERLGYIIGDAEGNGLRIPVSKGDISTNQVPNIEVTEGEVSVGIVVNNAEDLQDVLEDGFLNEESVKNVKLGSDLKGLTEGFTVKTEEITLDLNGFDIEVTGDDVFDVVEGAHLIIEGNDESIVKTGGARTPGVCTVWAHGGRVTVNGGYFQIAKDNDGKRNDCIYAGYNGDSEETAGIIIINGGLFEYMNSSDRNANDEKDIDYIGDMYLLNCADKDAGKDDCVIYVNGGSFKNYAPSNSVNKNEIVMGEGKKVTVENKAIGEDYEHDYSNVNARIWYTVQ